MCAVRNRWTAPASRVSLLFLVEKLVDGCHRQKKSFVNLRRVDKAIFQVERVCSFVLGVDNNACRCDLFAQFETAVESIHQQGLAKPLPPKVYAYGEAPEKCRGYQRIFG